MIISSRSRTCGELFQAISVRSGSDILIAVMETGFSRLDTSTGTPEIFSTVAASVCGPGIKTNPAPAATRDEIFSSSGVTPFKTYTCAWAGSVTSANVPAGASSSAIETGPFSPP